MFEIELLGITLRHLDGRLDGWATLDMVRSLDGDSVPCNVGSLEGKPPGIVLCHLDGSCEGKEAGADKGCS